MMTDVLMKVAAQGLLLAQGEMPDYGGGGGAAGGAMAAIAGVLFLIYGAVFLLVIIGLWKIFTKAGQPGWAAIVPIYNMVVLLNIVGKPLWWLALLLFCGPVGWIMVSLALAKSFGKETGFAIGLMILAPIFIPILGFGSAQYKGPAD
jgi:hypothetical protein